MTIIMRKTSLFLILCILSIVLCIPRTKSRRRHAVRFNRRALTRGKTWDGRPCPVENGCIELPKTSSVLTREEFETQVSRKKYFVLYQMFTVPMNNVYRFQSTYYNEGDNVFFDYELRPNGGDCFTKRMASLGQFISNSHAISFIPVIEFAEPVGWISPTYYFMTDCPSEYLLVFGCADPSTISNGFCNGGFFVDIALARDPPDSPPFWKIENELYRKMGLKMNDPLNKFLYIGEPCQNPA